MHHLPSRDGYWHVAGMYKELSLRVVLRGREIVSREREGGRSFREREKEGDPSNAAFCCFPTVGLSILRLLMILNSWFIPL